MTPEPRAFEFNVLRLQPAVVGSLQEPNPPQLAEIGAALYTTQAHMCEYVIYILIIYIYI